MSKNKNEIAKAYQAEANKEKYIDATLEFVESEEMKAHLRIWLTQLIGRRTSDACAEIVFGAPAPLEQKLQVLQMLSLDNSPRINSNVSDASLDSNVRELEKAVNELHSNPEGTVFELAVDDFFDDSYSEKTKMPFSSFDEAVEYIKNNGEPNCSHTLYKRTREMFCPVYWLLNDKGYPWYFERWNGKESRGYLDYPGVLRQFSVPFKPSDIVLTDCRPFDCGEDTKAVVILENKDTLDCMEYDNLTCLYMGDYDILDIGYFKGNEFMNFPSKTYISGMYRAKTICADELDNDSPLIPISKAIKANPELS
jgi:hypothetical protein